MIEDGSAEGQADGLVGAAAGVAAGGPARRSVLGLGAAAVLTGAAPAPLPDPVAAGPRRRLAALERAHAARLGVFALDTATGRTVAYRAAERFPICSVAKTLAVAAVLRDLDHGGSFLSRRFHYSRREVAAAGYAPVTGRAANLAHGMTGAELCAAALRYSDNAAMNLLLGPLGGPGAVTRFCRSLGDPTTRLDRWEPALNSAEPWRTSDTTSPYAIGLDHARLVLGDALAPGARARLTGWLLADTTGARRLHAGLPASWRLAEKTGTGAYGTAGDVGVAWPPGRAPIAVAVLSTKRRRDAPADEPLLAAAARVVAAALG